MLHQFQGENLKRIQFPELCEDSKEIGERQQECVCPRSGFGELRERAGWVEGECVVDRQNVASCGGQVAEVHSSSCVL